MKQALRWLDRALAWLVAALVLVLALIVLGQLVDRHFIDLPIHAPDQYARIVLVWLTFLGFALAVRGNVAVRVDVIDHWLSPTARRLTGIVSDLVLLLVLWVVMASGVAVVRVGAGQLILGTPFNSGLPNATLVVGCALMILYVSLRLVARCRGHDPVALEQPDC